MIRVRVTERELKELRRAGYQVATNKKFAIFGSMFSWPGIVSALRPGWWPAGGDSKPPVNAAASDAGQTVSQSSALRLSAVWACVWLNARVMASLPLNLMRYSNGDGKPDLNNPLYTVLRWQPNQLVDAYNFWVSMYASDQLWGAGCAEKFESGGNTVALEFMLPQYITPYLQNNQLRYRYDHPRNPKDLPASKVFRLMTRTLDGITGASVIEYGANAFGLAQSGELAASRTFKKGLNASGFIQVDKFLKEEQRTQFRASVDEFTGDGEKSGGTMVLEGGVTYSQLQMKPLDAQLLASRQFSVEDICRFFNVPPILVGHAAAGQTMWGSGVEQIFSGWLRLGLRPYITAAQQAIRSQLIAPADRVDLLAEFDLDDLLAPDSAARAALYATLSQNGVNTRNELREREGLGPMPGGDELTIQSNMMPLSQLGKDPAGGNGVTAEQKFRSALLDLLALEAPQSPPKSPPPPTIEG